MYADPLTIANTTLMSSYVSLCLKWVALGSKQNEKKWTKNILMTAVCKG